MTRHPNPLDHRSADHAIEPLFLRRWSPRAMTGEPVPRETLMQLLEAARWAPSAYNAQEWHFVWGLRDTPAWTPLFDLLVEANQTWCAAAGALVLVASRSLYEHNGKPNPVHAFDAGLATQNLLLQGTALGLLTHGMAGFRRGDANAALGMPEEFVPQAMVAIGHFGQPDQMPEDKRAGELNPSGRRPVGAISSEGRFERPSAA